MSMYTLRMLSELLNEDIGKFDSIDEAKVAARAHYNSVVGSNVNIHWYKARGNHIDGEPMEEWSGCTYRIKWKPISGEWDGNDPPYSVT